MIKTLIFSLLITMASAIPMFFPVISKPHITKKESSVPVEQKELDNCSICDFIVSKSEEYITPRTTYDDAFHIMKTNCNHLPKMKYNDCIEMVSKKGEKMIKMIAKKEDTSIICSNLHVCDKVVLDITDCFFCNYASKRITPTEKKNETNFL